jgi:(p)ppGpp synthase/HD superfamily hydrolase
LCDRLKHRVDPDSESPSGLSFARELPLTRAALEFAELRHAGQRRLSNGAPFLMHTVEVASLLEREGYPDHVVAAAVLHDVLEDSDTERAELSERFGPAVSDLVALVSDDPTIADEEARKDDVRERVRQAGGDALAVYASDKVSKVRELRYLVAAGLDRRQTETRLLRYRRSLAMLDGAAPGSRLVELLRFELESFDVLPPRSASPPRRTTEQD